MSEFITKIESPINYPVKKKETTIVTPINSPVKKKKTTIDKLEFTRRVDMKYLKDEINKLDKKTKDEINKLDMKTQEIAFTLNKLVRNHNLTNKTMKTQKTLTKNSRFEGGKRGKTLKKGVRKDNRKKRK